MPLIQKGNSILLQGISDYWLRFFADDGTFIGLGDGSQYLVGQCYLDLLTTLLRTAVNNMPIFDKHRWSLLILSRDSLTEENTSDGVRQVFEIPFDIVKFKFLYNKIYGPNRIFEDYFDFDIRTSGTQRYLAFAAGLDVFNLSGIAKRVSATGIEEIALWVPNTQVDEEWLFKDYGVFVDPRNIRPTSEEYRGFVYGLFNYFIKGPTLERMESALNIINGVPVTRNDGEIVTDIRNNIVITSDNIYNLPVNASVRVKKGDVLHAFQPISNSFIVGDYISHPEWWGGIFLNPTIMSTTATLIYTDVNPYHYDEAVGVASYPSVSSNATLIDWLTSNGDEQVIFPTPDPGKPASISFGPYPYDYNSIETLANKIGTPHQRHVFDRFDQLLKYHNFFVRYDASFPITQDFFQLDNVLREGRLAYTNYTLIPYIAINDVWTASEFVSIIRTIPIFERFDSYCPVYSDVVEHVHSYTTDSNGILLYKDYTNKDNKTFLQGKSQNDLCLSRWVFSSAEQVVTNNYRRFASDTSLYNNLTVDYTSDEFTPNTRVGERAMSFSPQASSNSSLGSGISSYSPYQIRGEDGFGLYFSFKVTEPTFNVGDEYPLIQSAHFLRSYTDNLWVGYKLCITKKTIEATDIIVFELTVRYPDESEMVINYTYDFELYNTRRGLYLYIDPVPAVSALYSPDATNARRRVLMYLDGEPLTLASQDFAPVSLTGTDDVDNIIPMSGSIFFGALPEILNTNSNIYIGKSVAYSAVSNTIEETVFPGTIYDFQVYPMLAPSNKRSDPYTRAKWMTKPSVVRGLGAARQDLTYKREARSKYWSTEAILLWVPQDTLDESSYERKTNNLKTYSGNYDVRHLVKTTNDIDYFTITETKPARGLNINTKHDPFSQVNYVYPDSHIDTNVYAIRKDGLMYGFQKLPLTDEVTTEDIDGTDPAYTIKSNVLDFHPPSQSLYDKTPFKDLFSLDEFSIRTAFTLETLGASQSNATAATYENSTTLYSIESSTGSLLRVFLTPRTIHASNLNTAPYTEYNPNVNASASSMTIELKRDAGSSVFVEVKNPLGLWYYLTTLTGTINLTVSYKAWDKLRVTYDSGPGIYPTIRPLITQGALSLAGAFDDDVLMSLSLLPSDDILGKHWYFETDEFVIDGPISPILKAAQSDIYAGYTAESLDIIADLTLSPEHHNYSNSTLGTVGDYTELARIEQDITQVSTSTSKFNIVWFELYTMAFTQQDTARASHVIAHNDPYVHYGYNPEYYDLVDIERVYDDSLAGPLVSLNLGDNVDPSTVYSSEIEELIYSQGNNPEDNF